MDWLNFDRIEVALTTYCNANCPLCMRTDTTTGKKLHNLPLIHYGLDYYKSIVDQLNENCQLYLCGDYGDPLMHPDIEEILDYTIQVKKHAVCIDTNGGLRNPDFYRTIAKQYGEEIWINFSIDGFDQVTNEKYRIGVDFSKCLENISAYAEINCKQCVWQMLIFDYNYKQIDTVAEFCRLKNIFFDFKINARRWNHTIADAEIIEYVQNKQTEYKDLMPLC